MFPDTFSNFLHDYDVKTLEIIHPITFRKYTKYLIKVFRDKNNMFFWEYVDIHNLFIKWLSALHLNILCHVYLITETFLIYNISFLALNYTKDKVCAPCILLSRLRFSFDVLKMQRKLCNRIAKTFTN